MIYECSLTEIVIEFAVRQLGLTNHIYTPIVLTFHVIDDMCCAPNNQKILC